VTEIVNTLTRSEKNRMKPYLFLVLFLAVPLGASPQEKSAPAPTLAQCQSDIDSWMADRWGINRLSLRQIQARIIELDGCGLDYHRLLRWKEYPSDTSPGKTSDLEAIESLYEAEIHDRYFSFIDRHGLLLQFSAEDEAGKR
jgi:hypothetical protein